MNTTPTNTVSLKELRKDFPKYIAAIASGQSFIVVKRSKPIFQLNPISDEGTWQTIVDFTKINNAGINANEVLAALE